MIELAQAPVRLARRWRRRDGGGQLQCRSVVLPALDEDIGELQMGALIGRPQPDGRLELLDALVVLLIKPVRGAQKPVRFGGIWRLRNHRCEQPLGECDVALPQRVDAGRQLIGGRRPAGGQRIGSGSPAKRGDCRFVFTARQTRETLGVGSRGKHRRLPAVVLDQGERQERSGGTGVRFSLALMLERDQAVAGPRGVAVIAGRGGVVQEQVGLRRIRGIQCPRTSKCRRRLPLPAAQLVGQRTEQVHVRALRCQRARRRKLPQRVVDAAPFQEHGSQRHAHLRRYRRRGGVDLRRHRAFIGTEGASHRRSPASIASMLAVMDGPSSPYSPGSAVIRRTSAATNGCFVSSEGWASASRGNDAKQMTEETGGGAVAGGGSKRPEAETREIATRVSRIPVSSRHPVILPVELHADPGKTCLQHRGRRRPGGVDQAVVSQHGVGIEHVDQIERQIRARPAESEDLRDANVGVVDAIAIHRLRREDD